MIQEIVRHYMWQIIAYLVAVCVLVGICLWLDGILQTPKWLRKDKRARKCRRLNFFWRLKL